ncbi:MAG: hypothetical protein AB4038_18545, partial [Prochloraceae cyanobacterium]
TGLEKFALRQVQEITGIDLNQFNLNDFTAMNWQSIASLTKAIPGLKDLPVEEVKVAYDLFNSVSSGQLATVLEEFDSASIGDILDFNPSWGEVPLGDVLNLSNYNLVNSIPGLIFSPIDTLSNWGQSLISQVPGLGLVPFSMFPLGFNLGAGAVAIADIVWSDAEYGDPSLNDAYFVSGEASGGSTVPKRCSPGKSCAYLELSDLLGANGPFYGKRWVSGNSQQVSGGEGLLKVVNGGKEPTGVMVYGNLFKVVLTGTDESTGTAKFGLYLRACPPPIFPFSKKLGCSPYFIGPIPWIPASEKQLIVMGGVNAPSINVPKQYQQQIDEVIAQYQPQQQVIGYLPPPGNINQAIVQTATSMRGFPTDNRYSPAATLDGRWSCAWAVNQVLMNSGIRPLGQNQLHVLSIEADLKNGRGVQVSTQQAQPGDIVLVDRGRHTNQQHIGICLTPGCTQAISNSSSAASFSWISDGHFSSAYQGARRAIYRVIN